MKRNTLSHCAMIGILVIMLGATLTLGSSTVRIHFADFENLPYSQGQNGETRGDGFGSARTILASMAPGTDRPFSSQAAGEAIRRPRPRPIHDAPGGGCTERDCGDGRDDDHDGLQDCADPDCDGVAGCEFGMELTCDDAQDNDGDLLVDCDDPDCGSYPVCFESICDDELDNDADGLADCVDPDCCRDLACDGIDGCEYGGEVSCSDSLDNDGDGLTDCDDADCGFPRCTRAAADAYVDQQLPSQNAGSYSYMVVRNRVGDSTSDWEFDSLVRFDLSAISVGTAVDSATLHLYYYRKEDQSPVGRALTCSRLTQNWSEGTVTWNNRPAHVPASTSQATVPESFGWMSWDVTADVRVFVNQPLASRGWIIRDETPFGQDSIPYVFFYTKENGLLVPYLDVVFRELFCDDALDNDADGLPDCLDPDCDWITGCEFGSEASCWDAFDNDGDGLTDCLDPDCDGLGLCEYGIEATCNDFFDNDGDLLLDCDDPDCESDPACLESICDDWWDNDGDGLTDCEDPDCAPLCSFEFTFVDTPGDDISAVALRNFFSSIQVTPTDHLFFEIVTHTGGFATCMERADWYRDQYLMFGSTSGTATSGGWNKWWRNTGPWFGPTVSPFQERYGGACEEIFSWCSPMMTNTVRPAAASTCEAFRGCGNGTWALTIRIAPTRMEACGF